MKQNDKQNTSKMNKRNKQQVVCFKCDQIDYFANKCTANIKNIGGRTGGAITAAAFLSHFVNDLPWAHIDIAGTAWTQDGTIEKSYNPKGATGFGIRTIVKLLGDNSLNK